MQFIRTAEKVRKKMLNSQLKFVLWWAIGMIAFVTVAYLFSSPPEGSRVISFAIVSFAIVMAFLVVLHIAIVAADNPRIRFRFVLVADLLVAGAIFLTLNLGLLWPAIIGTALLGLWLTSIYWHERRLRLAML
ncbi:MAG: hypothetical protein NUW02_02160 [Candidatus Campbellbacteria bacterium]|nr:hypothetical protein [Candidatus Campbellbacteria bacterium]